MPRTARTRQVQRCGGASACGCHDEERSRLGSGVTSILELQRLAGNGAVSALLTQRQADDHAGGDAGAGDLDTAPAGEAQDVETQAGEAQDAEAQAGEAQDVEAGAAGPARSAGCTTASSRLEAEAKWAFLVSHWLPISAAFGSETLGVWATYLDRAGPMPRPHQTFAGSGQVVDGFKNHHKSAEAEAEIVKAAASTLTGTGGSTLLPAPGTTTTMPVTSLVPAATLSSRLVTAGDPMALIYDNPATTIAGLLAGGISSGGPPGNTATDPDTRAVGGDLEIALDAAGTSATITPRLTFRCHDTVDFCPGGLGGFPATIFTLPMSVLEATEGRFGPIFAADVPFTVTYPGPGVPGPAITVMPPPAPVPPTPPPTPVPPAPTPTGCLKSTCFSGDADLEDVCLDRARLTMGGQGRQGTRKIETGPAVAKAQAALIKAGFLLASAATGVYDQETWDAVKDLKATEHLGWERMGDVGPKTIAFLDGKC